MLTLKCQISGGSYQTGGLEKIRKFDEWERGSK